MPKQIKELKDFSGGLNTKHDSKDIKDNEFIEAKGVMFDKPGRIRTSRRSEVANDGTVAISNWNAVSANKLENGYGLGFINTDTVIGRFRLEVPDGHSTPNDPSNWVGKFISPRASADVGAWGTNYTVFEIIEVNNTTTPNYLYCAVVYPGVSPYWVFHTTAYTYTMFLADSQVGASAVTTSLDFQNGASVTDIGSETLTEPSFTGADDDNPWNIIQSTTGWTITSNELRYDASVVASGMSSILDVVTQSEAHNAETWVPNAPYAFEIVFGADTDPFEGTTPLVVNFMGAWYQFRNSDLISDTVRKLQTTIISGDGTGAMWGGFFFLINQYTSDTSGDFVITSMSLKKHGWINNEDSMKQTVEGEASLVTVNATDNTLDRYSYETSIWSPVRTSELASAQAKLQNLSIDSSGVGTLADKTGGKVEIYQIDGALRFVDTNFMGGHLSDLYANYWLGRIKKTFFGDYGYNYDNWSFTLMDIYPPYSGTLHTSERTAADVPTLSEGHLTMMARPADPASSQTVWESGVDPDGWFAGKSGTSQSAYLYNRGASFPKAFLDTATNFDSDSNMVGAYCSSKDYINTANNELYLILQYHADYDYRGELNSPNPGIDMYQSSQKTIYIDMYISPDAFPYIHDTNGIEFNFGSHMTLKGAWNSSSTGVAIFKYKIEKTDIKIGWETYVINLNNWTDMVGSPIKNNLDKFAVTMNLNSGTVDVGAVTIPTINFSSDYTVVSATSSGSGSGASAVNHNQQITLDTDVAGAGFAVGDLIFANFGGDDSSTDTNDEFCTITKIDGTSMYVTRPYQSQNIWPVTGSFLSGGTQTYPGQSEAFDTGMKIQKTTAVPNPAIAISNISYGDLVEGDWNGEYKFFYSWVYDENQESKLYEYSGTVSASNQTMYFNFWMQEGVGGGFGLASTLGLSGHRIDKARIYYSKVSEEGELIDKRYYVLGELDLDLGFKFAGDEKYYAWTPDPINSTLLCIDTDPTTTDVRENLVSTSPPVVDVFESSAGYSNSTKSVMANFKDIAFNNGIAYVAYPFQASNTSIDTSKQEKKGFPDRILKSLPNQYDIFPSDNFIDVVIDDGESVVAIETFNDRLLQFKQNTLYVINIAGELEFLEDTFAHLGIQNKGAVVKSDVGILFANRNGIYLYPGSGEPVNLTGKVNETDWNAFAGDGSALVCIYIPSMDQLVVAKTSASDAESDTYIVDIPTQTVSKTTDGLDLSEQYGYTNVILDTVNGQPIWISDDNTNEKVYTIDNFDDSTSASAGHASGNFELKTKFYDFDRPGVRKKIHKVRINYKSTGTTNVSVKFDVDQGSAFTKQFSNGTNFTSDELANTSGAWYIAELKPDTSSEVNNIYSFALKMYSDGIVPEDFQINDISIVYRYKSVK